MLFVFRKMALDGQWHLRCLSCGSTRPETWDPHDSWKMYLDSSESIQVRLNDQGWNTSVVPSGPCHVYGGDPAIESLQDSPKSYAIESQRPVVLVTDDDLTNIALPRYLSIESHSMMRFEAVVIFASPMLEDFPYVRDLKRQMWSVPLGEANFRLRGAGIWTRTRIPVGFFLPAKIVTNRKETWMVFAIKEWWTNHQALIEGYVSEPVFVNHHSILTHRYASSSYERVLGNVMEYMPQREGIIRQK